MIDRKAEIERAARAMGGTLQDRSDYSLKMHLSFDEQMRAAAAAITPLLDRMEAVERVVTSREDEEANDHEAAVWADGYNHALDAVSAALQTEATASGK